MKKKVIIVLILVLLLANCYFIYDKFNTKEEVLSSETKEVVSFDNVAMMLETTSGSGEYALSVDTSWPDSSVYTFNESISKCENGSTLSWDSENNELVMIGTKSDKCYAYFDMNKFDFDYTGDEQTYTVAVSGYYKLEVWGASGADVNSTLIGGYGGYSVGEIYLEEGTVLYINVGGEGGAYEYDTDSESTADGGYNGGGYGHVPASSSTWPYRYLFGGGGATHIATTSGLLSTLEDNQDQILIVAGGGGSASAQMGNLTTVRNSSGTSYGIDIPQNYSYTTGGSGGGYIGNSLYVIARYWAEKYMTSSSGNYAYSIINSSTDAYYNSMGGSQTDSGILTSYNMTGFNTYDDAGFGHGATLYSDLTSSMAREGGGGGYYGGAMGAGGSGYIGNSSLTNKSMYCYECSESTDDDTYTVSTTNVSSEAISYYAKDGNGYARITYLGS